MCINTLHKKIVSLPIIIIIIIIIIIELMHTDTTNVEPEMYDYTGNNWSHWGCNEKLKGKIWKLYQENIR
jgi:hypothetical protein